MASRRIVVKFGGTSVGSADRIKAVAQLLNNNTPKIIVLSAMSGTTNTLVQISSWLFTSDKEKALNGLEKLRLQYEEVIALLGLNELLESDCKQYLNEQIDQMRTLAAIPFAKSYEKIILSKGEILSTYLFQAYCKSNGINCVLISALDFMKIDANQEPDKVFISEKLHQILERESAVTNIVTQGFICMNHQHEIDNLKRGGSDYSASLIGEAINAIEIQIWTDIDGLHNNDPRFVAQTRPINHISFDEAAELAYFGAKILHPASIQPAKNKNIPVLLKNTMLPQAAGTLIDSTYEASEIKAIAAKDGITAIKIKSTRMLLAYGFLRKIFEIFERYQTPIDMITTSEVAVSVTIDQLENLESIVRELDQFGEIEIDKHQSIICIVGNFIAAKSGIASKIFNALENVPLRMISYGGSKHNISVLIAEENKSKALNQLHHGLFS